MTNFTVKNLFFLTLCAALLSTAAQAQVRIGYGTGNSTTDALALTDYANPKEYVIDALTITGTKFLDPNSLVSLSGLKVGDKIKLPGEVAGSSIRKLMESGLLDDVELFVTDVKEGSVSLRFQVRERPRLFEVRYVGIRKGEQESLREKLKEKNIKGRIITNTVIKNTQLAVKRYFVDKGYLNAKIRIAVRPDSTRNNAQMRVLIDKGQKVKINNIEFAGRNEVDEGKIRNKMKGTKQARFGRLFSPSKFVPKKYEEDKQKLIEFYNKEGYRDAVIEGDSVIPVSADAIALKININEGRRYYIRNVTFAGNYIYTDAQLRDIMSLRKGDVYNPEDIEKKKNGIPGQDLSSQYMDRGYLYYNAETVEKKIEGDSIDLELRIFEGRQATINRIVLNGNTKTSDHVVLRQIRTLPGQKFSKTDIIRTQQALSQLGYFDPEKIGIVPVPQPDGTVDIEYTVEEKPNDQIELSGGWGGFIGFVGTLGLTFNNFSARNIPNLSAWRPLPSGDGQRLGIRFQASGRQFQVYSINFTEPWLGGKKPNALSVGLNYTVFRQFNQLDLFRRGAANAQAIGQYNNLSLSVGLGRQLRIPDDYFTLSHSITYQRYDLNNINLFQGFNFTNGVANNFTFNTTLARNSVDNPQFPRGGSSFSLSGSFTPPYSLFRGQAATQSMTDNDRFKWVEYHKWMFDASWFQTVVGKFVLNARAHMGFLGSYNSYTPIGPFERFVLGGAGLAGQGQFALAQDIIGLRGYPDRQVYTADFNRTTDQFTRSGGGVVYNKYILELRYPVSLAQSATIFLLTFLEGGNNWATYKQFNPFDIRRSAGVGARIFMPAFGLIGIDYAYGFDEIPGVQKRGVGQFHFTIGQQIR